MNLESVFNSIKAMELKNKDLKRQMQQIMQQMNSCSDFSYADVDNYRRLNKNVNELLDEYSKNLTAINSMMWVIRELKKDEV